MNAVVEHLKKVRALIDKPVKWNKGGYARDALGIPTPWYSHDAACYCIAGASRRAADPRYNGNGRQAVGQLEHTAALAAVLGTLNLTGKPYKSIPDWNDDELTTHPEVIATIDQTIERLS